MNCIWQDIGERDDKGFRDVRCTRRGCGIVGNSPYPHEKIRSQCRGLPLANEWREWITFFAEAFGINHASAIVRYIRWRAKGSPLSEIPPRIPPPPIAPKPLTDSEITELFPGEDPTLLGNRIKALTDRFGIPPCAGCGKRQKWINDVHEWLRATL
jgi:hypothetical protein